MERGERGEEEGEERCKSKGEDRREERGEVRGTVRGNGMTPPLVIAISLSVICEKSLPLPLSMFLSGPSATAEYPSLLLLSVRSTSEFLESGSKIWETGALLSSSMRSLSPVCAVCVGRRSRARSTMTAFTDGTSSTHTLPLPFVLPSLFPFVSLPPFLFPPWSSPCITPL